MITLDMSKKDRKVPIPIQAFSTENGVVTLEISVGGYDLTNKTITAVFEGKPETAPLSVVDGLIQVPITSDLVEQGKNLIQINFRWGVDTLEQSPVMLWEMNKSLAPNPVGTESVDIITALILQCNAATSAAEEAATNILSVFESSNYSVTENPDGTIKFEKVVS